MWQFVFYRRGWRQPLDDTSQCEVWCGMKLLGILPGALVCQIISHFLSSAFLSRAAGDRLDHADFRFPLARMSPLDADSASLPRLVGVRRRLRGWRMRD